jgi:hypothetical protein
MFSWVTITPFGSPVEPEVKIMYAQSFGLRGAVPAE